MQEVGRIGKMGHRNKRQRKIQRETTEVTVRGFGGSCSAAKHPILLRRVPGVAPAVEVSLHIARRRDDARVVVDGDRADFLL